MVLRTKLAAEKGSQKYSHLSCLFNSAMLYLPQASALPDCVPICLSRLQRDWMISSPGVGAAGVLQRDPGCKPGSLLLARPSGSPAQGASWGDAGGGTGAK